MLRNIVIFYEYSYLSEIFYLRNILILKEYLYKEYSYCKEYLSKEYSYLRDISISPQSIFTPRKYTRPLNYWQSRGVFLVKFLPSDTLNLYLLNFKKTFKEEMYKSVLVTLPCHRIIEYFIKESIFTLLPRTSRRRYTYTNYIFILRLYYYRGRF